MAASRPPERLEGEGVLVRRATVADAGLIARAVAESLDHLRPWMPWATESAAREVAQRARLLDADRQWDDGEAFGYVVLDPDGSTLLGDCGLMARLGPGALELGYWVHVAHVSRGVGTAAAAVLTGAALALDGVERVEVHCDEANVASARIPAKLGYELDRVVTRQRQAPAESGREQVWIKGGPGSARP